MRSRWFLGVVLVALGVAFVSLGAIALPAVGVFLVVADRLEPSDAIFVLDGRTPERELEAAALYHGHYARLIVLTLPSDPVPPFAYQLAGAPSRQERAAVVLEHAGVPSSAIVRLRRIVENLDQELEADFAFARSKGFRRVILVTSAPHTRRVKLIWQARFGRAPPARVYPTPWEAYAPERWWQSRRYLEWTAQEIAGIAHFYLGSPLRTFEGGD